MENKMNNIIKLAIRQLVEFILRQGDIDNRYVEKDRMSQGSIAHRQIQKACKGEKSSYESEVWLSLAIDYKNLQFNLEGRADGIFTDNEKIFVDEIKTTTLPISDIDEFENSMHWAQARCYAYIYAVQNDIENISVQLTYYKIDTKETRYKHCSFNKTELQLFIYDILDKYIKWAEHTENWSTIRNASIKLLNFPFASYRKGQRALAVSTYKAITGKSHLFVQAPTGIGKTISTIFPAVKAIGEMSMAQKASKIFYLTAKTITRQVAEEAFEKMRLYGLKFKTLTLTAKEKICFLDEPKCNADHCEYAKGHFDRVNNAILDIVQNCDNITRETVEQFALKHKVCPFEFALDISLWVDCVICDYNYVFDPKVYLKRFFSENGGDFVFLIDEAHNLVDRARNMYSAELLKTHFYSIKKEFKGKSKALTKILDEINRYFIEQRKKCGELGYAISPEPKKDFFKLLNTFIAVCENTLHENKEFSEFKDFMQLYFDALFFILIFELYDQRYVTFTEAQNNEVSVKMLCLDPSNLLCEALKRGSSAIMFSATLTPLTYFREILGGSEQDKILTLSSPFESSNLCLLVADNISTKFKDREKSSEKINRLIISFISQKIGNYIIYFPSYKFMNDVYEQFLQNTDVITIVQQPSMTEEDREQFLASFKENPNKTMVAFCVLGGIFAEGIDLIGSRLIGTVIVGVGLPQLSTQQNIIKDYFGNINNMGFEYAYMYPGMNKVLQAAGRVIRHENDTGAVLLIDERFTHRAYKQLYPKHWEHFKLARDEQTLNRILREFWE
jgi:DNA excision repair protein ERCC-2